MQDFVVEVAQLAAQLLIARTKAERDAVNAQIDMKAKILVGTLSTIAESAVLSFGQMFAIEGCNCLEPKARLSGEHPGGELDDTGFVGKFFSAMPQGPATLVDLKGFPIGDVGCWQYTWKIFRVAKDGALTFEASIGPADDKAFIQYPFPPGRYHVEVVAARCDGAPQGLNGDMDVYVFNAALVPDYDRNGDIDEADRQKLQQGETLYFWINDDSDNGAYDENALHDWDIPFASRNITYGVWPDWKTMKADGVRDLIDFFPIWVDIEEALSYLSPADYDFILKHEDLALNAIAGLSLGPDKAGYHLVNQGFAESHATAGVEEIGYDGWFSSKGGWALPEAFLNVAGDGRGLILAEGRKASTRPLILEIHKKKGDTVFEVNLPLSLDRVEHMYRYLNLRKELGETGTRTKTNLDEPSNYPDRPNGKNLIFIHGYKVHEINGVGWLAETFKRFYWSGSNARFHGVAWWGDIGADANYQGNIVNAFDTAYLLKNALGAIPGDNILVAHSAGNVVASWAIVNEGLNVQKYCMLDAAVPLEAYDSSAAHGAPALADGSANPMVHSSWRDYPPETWSANYHTLFESPDARAGLTWRGLFQAEKLLSIAYNFYSGGETWYSQRGDEVFEIRSDLSGGILDALVKGLREGDFARFAWQVQEILKGAGLVAPGTPYAGWGFKTLALYTSPPPAANSCILHEIVHHEGRERGSK